MKGLPANSIGTIENSLAAATRKQYSTTYKLWWAFCSTNHIDPFRAEPNQAIKFLQEQLDLKPNTGYGTLNQHRSALALILDNLSCSGIVKRFMRGVFKMKPLTTKYRHIWDPKTVLNYIESLGPNSSLSLRQLTMKTVTLLALISGHRLQTLSLIRLENINQSPQGFEIWITDHIKTSRVGGEQPTLQVPFFQANPSLCAATTLKDYLKATQPLRKDEFLFITFRQPHRTASKDSISRWVKEVLKAAGVDMNVFAPHSTRHAVTSAAYKKGLSWDIIRRSAGWSQNSQVFAKFYNRPTQQHGSSLAPAILAVNN
ncbi:integrase/recombinase xerD homolog [Tenebrio molitor]|jgi:hypothetical protein|uniref:integrase/recombinase xerD homolog n=1 Tax=Tenebrio molitor TaxID=7067 RepID=UPI003624A0CE